MKTRIVRTSLHDYEEFINISKDAKLLFLHLCTSDEIGHSNIFYYPDRKIAYYLGFTADEIKKAKEELEKSKFARFYENYIWLNPEYAVPTSGPKNKVSRLKEYSSLPGNIKEYFEKDGYCIDTVSIQYQYTSDTTINHKSSIINHKPEIINNDAPKKSFAEMKAAIGVMPSGISTAWQDDAFRHADYLGITLKGNEGLKSRWLGFYKRSYPNKALYGQVQRALSFLKDYNPFLKITNAEGRMRYFFDVVQNYEKYQAERR